MIARIPIVRHIRTPFRAQAVPIASTIAGSATVLMPMIATGPLMPQFGLLMLLAWRLLRPEMWPAWVALPLGLVDDLLTGHYIGTSMALWTAALLAFDWIDHHFVWRGYRAEWLLAALAILGIGTASWALSQTAGATGTLANAIPLIIVDILIFPAMVRLTAGLDAWRLRR